jgi:hypothetical protein
MDHVIRRVVIGVDPHKLSATIEVVDPAEAVLVKGRFGTDGNGYRRMLALGRRWPVRVWAVEGSQGIGRHVAQRLVRDGEQVLGVPAKLSPPSPSLLHRAGSQDRRHRRALASPWSPHVHRAFRSQRDAIIGLAN